MTEIVRMHRVEREREGHGVEDGEVDQSQHDFLQIRVHLL